VVVVVVFDDSKEDSIGVIKAIKGTRSAAAIASIAEIFKSFLPVSARQFIQ